MQNLPRGFQEKKLQKVFLDKKQEGDKDFLHSSQAFEISRLPEAFFLHTQDGNKSGAREDEDPEWFHR